MSETEYRTRRAPTKGFPTIALPDAVERVAEIARYGKEHSRTAFAQYLGHETPNSGPFKRKLAAYRDWGFVATSANTVTLTDLALRLAIPLDDLQAREDLVEAFNQCEPFSDVYGAMAKGVDLELTAVANTAVHRVGIAPSARESFAESFARSAIAAGLAEEPAPGRVRLLIRRESHPSTEPHEAADSPVDHDLRAGAFSKRTASAPQTSMSMPWAVVGGQITLVLELDHGVPPEAFQQLSQVSAAIEELVRLLGSHATAVSAARHESGGELPTAIRAEDEV